MEISLTATSSLLLNIYLILEKRMKTEKNDNDLSK